METQRDDFALSGKSLFQEVVLDDYYGPETVLDEAIALLLNALAEGMPPNRDNFVDSLDEHDRKVLGRFAHRASMLALRARAPNYLRAGLLAICFIEQKVPDWRDNLVFFAPYVFVAKTLEVDPAQLFDDVAQHAVPELANVMRVFGRRTDVTLAAFGWRLVESPEGATFESIDWGGKPSGAVVGERSWTVVNQALAQKLMTWIKSQTG